MFRRRAAEREFGLDEEAALSHLEALAHTLGIQVRYESLGAGRTPFRSGGLCRIRDKQVVLVDERANAGEKVRTLARALSRFDFNHIYLRPAVRDLLAGYEKDGE